MATKSQLLANSIRKQLKARDAEEYHFQKMIEDYCNLNEIKDSLQKSIRENGTVIKEKNSKGFDVTKTNPAISEMIKVEAQMLKIASTLGLTPEENIKDIENEADGL